VSTDPSLFSVGGVQSMVAVPALGLVLDADVVFDVFDVDVVFDATAAV
jgi:hypothetical protein